MTDNAAAEHDREQARLLAELQQALAPALPAVHTVAAFAQTYDADAQRPEHSGGAEPPRVCELAVAADVAVRALAAEIAAQLAPDAR